jgi:hypothetical protein
MYEEDKKIRAWVGMLKLEILLTQLGEGYEIRHAELDNFVVRIFSFPSICCLHYIHSR